MTMVQLQFIAGCMLGIEFPPPEDEETFVMTIDILFVRMHVVKVK
jgi:hypothetical protein